MREARGLSSAVRSLSSRRLSPARTTDRMARESKSVSVEPASSEDLEVDLVNEGPHALPTSME